MDAEQKIMQEICEALARATAILIGAGAGLSSAAGLDYSGEAFRKKFADYIARYGFSDLYSSGFHPFPTKEERWTYWPDMWILPAILLRRCPCTVS